MEVQSYLTNAVTPGGLQAKRLDALVGEFSEFINLQAKQMDEQLKFLTRTVYTFELPSPPLPVDSRWINARPKLAVGEGVFDSLVDGSLIESGTNVVSKRKLIKLVSCGYTNKRLSDAIKRLAGQSIVIGDTLVHLTHKAGRLKVIGKVEDFGDGACVLLALNEIGYIVPRITLAADTVQTQLKSRDYHASCHTYIARDKTLVKVNVCLADWQYVRRATAPIGFKFD